MNGVLLPYNTKSVYQPVVLRFCQYPHTPCASTVSIHFDVHWWKHTLHFFDDHFSLITSWIILHLVTAIPLLTKLILSQHSLKVFMHSSLVKPLRLGLINFNKVRIFYFTLFIFKYTLFQCLYWHRRMSEIEAYLVHYFQVLFQLWFEIYVLNHSSNFTRLYYKY